MYILLIKKKILRIVLGHTFETVLFLPALLLGFLIHQLPPLLTIVPTAITKRVL